MNSLPPDLNDIYFRILDANKNFLEAETDRERRTQMVAQLDALIDLATELWLVAHLAPTRRAIQAIAALNLGSRDKIFTYDGEKRPTVPPHDANARAWLAAVAEWFMRDGMDEEPAARETAHEANHTNVKWKQVRKWRQQYSGAGDGSTHAHALAVGRFRNLTSKLPVGCRNAREAAIRLAKTAAPLG